MISWHKSAPSRLPSRQNQTSQKLLPVSTSAWTIILIPALQISSPHVRRQDHSPPAGMQQPVHHPRITRPSRQRTALTAIRPSSKLVIACGASVSSLQVVDRLHAFNLTMIWMYFTYQHACAKKRSICSTSIPLLLLSFSPFLMHHGAGRYPCLAAKVHTDLFASTSGQSYWPGAKKRDFAKRRTWTWESQEDVLVPRSRGVNKRMLDFGENDESERLLWGQERRRGRETVCRFCALARTLQHMSAVRQREEGTERE